MVNFSLFICLLIVHRKYNSHVWIKIYKCPHTHAHTCTCACSLLIQSLELTMNFWCGYFSLNWDQVIQKCCHFSHTREFLPPLAVLGSQIWWWQSWSSQTVSGREQKHKTNSWLSCCRHIGSISAESDWVGQHESGAWPHPPVRGGHIVRWMPDITRGDSSTP